MGGLLRFGVKLGNERFEALLESVGAPHRSLRVLHVGGTKGKGSTSTFAASILRAAGYRVGAYLSPYVYDLRERIQVDGEMIPEDDFARIVTELRPHIEDVAAAGLGSVTEFELKTAVGFLYFAERNVDYAVVEVGLGGRLDATNVLPHPLVSVVTNVGMDHVEFLGNTLSAIAGEKAGIIKPGGVCVTGIENDTPFAVVADVARQRGAKLIRVEERRSWRTEGDRTLSICGPGIEISHVSLMLRGRFQHANAALAAIAVAASGIPVPSEAYRKGIETATLPGRFEVIRPSGPTIIADVAHNELAGRVLREALVDEASANERPVILVVGVSRNHDPAEILLPLLRTGQKRAINIAALIATEPAFRPRPVEDVVNAAKGLGLGPVHIEGSVKDAAVKALILAQKLNDPVVVVTGSFYTVGELTPPVWEHAIQMAGCRRQVIPLNKD